MHPLTPPSKFVGLGWFLVLRNPESFLVLHFVAMESWIELIIYFKQSCWFQFPFISESTQPYTLRYHGAPQQNLCFWGWISVGSLFISLYSDRHWSPGPRSRRTDRACWRPPGWALKSGPLPRHPTSWPEIWWNINFEIFYDWKLWKINSLDHKCIKNFWSTDLVEGMKQQGLPQPFAASIAVNHQILNPSLRKISYLNY